MTAAKLKLKIGIIIALGLLVAAAAAVVYFPRESLASAEEAPAQSQGAEVWFCPMHAHVTSDHEGSCPICGMKLVKRPSASAKLPAGMSSAMSSHMNSDAHDGMHHDAHGEMNHDAHSGMDHDAHAGMHHEAHGDSHAGMHADGHAESHAGMHPEEHAELHSGMHSEDHAEAHSQIHPEGHSGSAMPPEARTDSHSGMHPEAHPVAHSSDHSNMHPQAQSEAQSALSAEQVFVPPPMQSRLGVVTEAIQPVDFSPMIPVTALAVADARRAITSSTKVEGWIRRLGVSVVGQPVHIGDVLYEIYSPELQQRQRDYIDLLTRRDSLLEAKSAGGGMKVGNSSPDLMLASVARERYRARTRLIAADVPVPVLDDIERFRRVHDVVAVLAQREGIVTTIDAREGSYIRPGETVLSYSDPRARWAEISVNPESLGQVSNDTVVELYSTLDRAQMISVPLNTRAATVDPVTRLARLRVQIPDAAAVFLPGTLLDGRIVMKPRRALTVSVDTVLRTGSGDFVVLAEAADHFTKAPVRLGVEAGDRVEVLEGLRAGQRVVTNGQFLLSAESSFRSTWRRLTADTAAPMGQDTQAMADPMHSSHEHLVH